MRCPRCEQETGNHTQGHFWSLCKVWMKAGNGLSGSIRRFHFCCPDGCELPEQPRWAARPKKVNVS